MKNALLVYNPNAGRFPPAETAKTTGRALTDLGWKVEIVPSKDAAHVTELAHRAAREKLDVLIVAGGDGTIGRTIPGLINSSTCLSIIPSGTTNVWAKELNLPMISAPTASAVIKNAELIADAKPKRVDVGVLDDTHFLLWTGMGLDAMIVKNAEAQRSHLKKRLVVPEYFLRLLFTSARWRGMDLKVDGLRADQETKISFEGRAQMALVSNIKLYAGGLAEISPAAEIDDGEMDLWVFHGAGVFAAVRNAWNLIKGKHVNHPKVIRIPFAKLDLQAETDTAVHVDGDPIVARSQVKINVLNKALKVLIPPQPEEKPAV